MNHSNRRTFLKSFLLSSIGIGVITHSSLTNAKVSGNTGINRQIEIVKAYACWKTKHELEPGEFLAQKLANVPYDARVIMKYSQNDFITGNTIDIEGLILSDIETALILSLYLN